MSNKYKKLENITILIKFKFSTGMFGNAGLEGLIEN